MNFLDEVLAKRQKLAAVLVDEDYSGIRAIVEELYPDRAHFLFELLQNAEDAGATEVWFDLRPDMLGVTLGVAAGLSPKVERFFGPTVAEASENGVAEPCVGRVRPLLVTSIRSPFDCTALRTGTMALSVLTRASRWFSRSALLVPDACWATI